MRKVGKRASGTLVGLGCSTFVFFFGFIILLVGYLRTGGELMIFAFVVFLFALIGSAIVFFFELKRQDDGIYYDGENVCLVEKGRRIEIPLRSVKRITTNTLRCGNIKYTIGNVSLDGYTVKHIQNSEDVVAYLLKERDRLMGR